MIFSILLVLTVLLVLASVVSLFMAIDKGSDGFFGAFLLSGVVGFFIGLTVLAYWEKHANNIATVHHQQPVIDALTERVEGITERLSNFDYPRAALVNRDTPVAAIVASLDNAESQLADAKLAQGEAIRALEATRLGPLSHVFWWVGDYK